MNSKITLLWTKIKKQLKRKQNIPSKIYLPSKKKHPENENVGDDYE